MTTAALLLEQEDRQLAANELALVHSHPEVAPEVIHTLVEQAYDRLTPARVHSYLPILVAREVGDTLRRRRRAESAGAPRHGATLG